MYTASESVRYRGIGFQLQRSNGTSLLLRVDESWINYS